MDYLMDSVAITNQDTIFGVILAAGKGVRAYPATRDIPKVLLDIAGKTLIERNLDLLVGKLGITDIIIVIGHYGDQIEDRIGDSFEGARIRYVRQANQKGIGHAVLAVEPLVGDSRFITILGDELYIDSNHHELLDVIQREPSVDAVLMFKHEDDPAKISNNYTPTLDGDRVMGLIEKPVNPLGNIMGLGTYLLNAKVFDYIRNTRPSTLRDEVEITDALSNMAQKENVKMLMSTGKYLNVNTTDDRNLANYSIRDRGFGQYKISVVVPAYNEDGSIGSVVQEYLALSCVDEVLVVDNNSSDKTAEKALNAGARVVQEHEQGYGCALRRGLDDATGDIVILTEADGSFSPADVPKLLEYLKDCDMVLGTRTTRQMIEQGANMNAFPRFMNILFGKIIELLWWDLEPRFTDVGCTYRAIWKTSYDKIRPYVRSDGPAYSPDMTIAVLNCKLRVIEIPVTYRMRRSGDSSHSANVYQLARTAFQMAKVIVHRRLFYSRLNLSQKNKV
jgi:dTDP-glucose pyrophosphorylase